MIQPRTVLKVADNSGAKTVRCLKVLGGFKRRYAHLGDIVVVSVTQLRNRFKLTSRVKKGEVLRAVIIRTRTPQWRKDGSATTLSENSVVLLNKKGGPMATRIVGPVPRNLRYKRGGGKLFSISAGVVL